MNLTNKLQVPESMLAFLKRNEMIKTTGEFLPTISDVIKAKGTSWNGSYVKTTDDAINKLKKQL